MKEQEMEQHGMAEKKQKDHYGRAGNEHGTNMEHPGKT
jgi:hypothetical protein